MQIHRKYPGRKASEIYEKVDEVMARLARKFSLEYRTDESGRTGKVTRMGIAGTYHVKDGEVTLELKYPMLVPGALRKTVEEHIHANLDGLFS
jgi:hypothetical protein